MIEGIPRSKRQSDFFEILCARTRNKFGRIIFVRFAPQIMSSFKGKRGQENFEAEAPRSKGVLFIEIRPCWALKVETNETKFAD